MTKKQKSIESQKWEAILNFFATRVSEGENLDLRAILFLIGVRELGYAYKKFKKDEKLNILHVAVCRILEPYGFYTFEKFDEQGWPHFTNNKAIPTLSEGMQTIMMKKAIIRYFEDNNLLIEEFFRIENTIISTP